MQGRIKVAGILHGSLIMLTKQGNEEWRLKGHVDLIIRRVDPDLDSFQWWFFGNFSPTSNY